MSLLASTIADARRPLPGRVIRRSPIDTTEPETVDSGDPAALTVYRLQKESTQGRQVRAPVARSGPSVGALDAHDVQGAGAERKLEGLAAPFVGWKNESKVRESRIVLTEARVSDVPEPLSSTPERASASIVQTVSEASISGVDSKSETGRRTENTYEWRRAARGAPSEDLDTPVADVGMEITTPEAATPLDVAHGEEFVAATSAPAESPAPARAAIASSTGLRTLANAAAAAAMAAHPRDRSRARQTSQPFAPSAADAVVPGGVKIGRIDVTVLADAPPAQPAAPAAERNFLSRHYLRRP